MIHARLFLAGLAPVLALAQPAPANLRFEVADVHVSPKTRNALRRGPMTRDGLYEVRFATMVDLIGIAYGIEAEKIVGGPSWLESDHFDVIAKGPAGTTIETARPMLQALLADRFSLSLHRETRPVPAYALRASAHPKWKQSEDAEAGRCRFVPQAPPAPGAPAAPAPFAW